MLIRQAFEFINVGTVRPDAASDSPQDKSSLGCSLRYLFYWETRLGSPIGMTISSVAAIVERFVHPRIEQLFGAKREMPGRWAGHLCGEVQGQFPADSSISRSGGVKSKNNSVWLAKMPISIV